MTKRYRKTIVMLLVATTILILNNSYWYLRTSMTAAHSRLIFLTNLAVQNDNTDQILDLVKNIQWHKEMWESYYLGDASKLLNADEKQRFLQALNLRENIYPFNRNIYKSVSELYSSYKGRGIVITTGDRYTKYDDCTNI